MKREHTSWIDAAKGLGIIAVVLGHIASPLSTFIYSWHMPLFFALSGFFISSNKNTLRFIRTSFTRLMIPYFLFSALGVLVETLKRFALARPALDYYDQLTAIFWWMDQSSLSDSYAFVLWFLPSLFFSKLLVIMILKACNFFLGQLFFILLFFLIGLNIQLPFSLDNAFICTFYLWVGYLISQKDFLYQKLLSYVWVPGLIFFGLPVIDIANKSFNSIAYSLIYSTSFIQFIVLVFKVSNGKETLVRILEFSGKESMFIFLMHPYTNNIAHIVSEKFSMGFWGIKFFVSIALLIPLVAFKRRYSSLGIFRYV